ncbi:hypothetical protein GWG54_16975 [Natronococcus sp. JC468]|uniref:hypothetical protein n=1 Tax=Natronococcus sp. JC468 TaxID=1961921 RepID=UPI00143AFFBE|nr:hypothetical protein [Natronococcus sp. JC468]NKE37470.1 hypothetical protein [Natronococcus sp. JC468]
MAVLEHINTKLGEELLEATLDESDLTLVTFENQIIGDGSVPDASIQSSTSLWFETKTVPNSVDLEQIRNHLSGLRQEASDTQRLVVLTPDHSRPKKLDQIEDDRLVWTNFDQLVDAAESILARDHGSAEQSLEIPTEREAFLLRELVRFLYEEDLVSGREDRVLVVAARKAWPEYNAHGLYFCQPNRSFKPSNYLAFYTDGEIKPAVPAITSTIESIELTEDALEEATQISPAQRRRLEDGIATLRDQNADRYGSEQKVLFLDLERGFTLEQPVQNDKTASESDRTVAFVQGHRYVSASALRDNPTTTSTLEN